MAASIVTVNPSHLPVVSVPQLTKEAASNLSELMSENHLKHHVYFNDAGFHNHIAHHLLSIYATGATPEQLKYAFRHNAEYQRTPPPQHPQEQSKLHDPEVFKAHMSNGANYPDFLAFFTAEIASRGVAGTLEEYVFKGDERAESMFTRLFASFLHPLIHFGLAMEFSIPAMVAEALSWTAVHRDELGDYIRNTEQLAKSTSHPSPPPSLMSLFHSAETPEIRNGVKPGMFLRGGMLHTDAQPDMEKIAAQYVVPQGQAQERLAEAINVLSAFTIGAQKAPYTPKVDFFLVHVLNSTVFLPALARELKPAQFSRLLEATVRTSLFVSGANNAPALDIDYYLSFARDPARRAKQYSGTEYPTWESLFDKANGLDDDGHVVKAIRALKGGEDIAGKQSIWEEPLKKADFLDAAAVLMRSVEDEPDFVNGGHGPTNQWVRGCGFDASWEPFAKIE